MNLEDRTRVIYDKVRRLDARFGRPADASYKDVDPRARIITDEPAIWKALLAPGYTPNSVANPTDLSDDRPWALLQVWAYDRLRVTAHVRDDDIATRLYMPGAWEPIFFVAELPELPALVPGGATGVFAGLSSSY